MNDFRWVLAPAAFLAAFALNPASAQDRHFDFNRMWSGGRADGKGRVTLFCPPMKITDIGKIIPMGMMVGGHVMPIDHQYYFPRDMNARCDVFAPADGHIVMIGHRVKLTGSSERQRDYDDYALHIEHTGTFYTFFDLLTELDPLVLKAVDETTRVRFERKQGGPPVHVRIPVKTGQVVGKVKGRSLDMSVIDTETRLKGFLSPELYGHYAWRVHVVDPFECFKPELRSELLKLNPRSAEPRGGKIDYDIDGFAVGNWFREGTNGYAGNGDRRGYWMGHLALAYHHLDPTVIVVSIGDFDSQPRQFVVKGNAPDPAKVSARNGLVKYELEYSPIDSNGRRMELPQRMRGAQGMLLIQVLAGRKLRAEVFPNKPANAVAGFTNAAATYYR